MRPQILFQSRNRESFGFYAMYTPVTADALKSFNLVIESLLVSTQSSKHTHQISPVMFQSRNRESFGFYNAWMQSMKVFHGEFQSRNRESFGFYRDQNLKRLAKQLVFQSRNRESFGFYPIPVGY